jgi:hypothetical protein
VLEQDAALLEGGATLGANVAADAMDLLKNWYSLDWQLRCHNIQYNDTKKDNTFENDKQQKDKSKSKLNYADCHSVECHLAAHKL